MSAFRKVKAGLVNGEISQFVGEIGNIFFNVDTGEFRLSDGITPGGLPIGGAGGGSSYAISAYQNYAPVNPSNGMLWYNFSTDTLLIYDSTGWIEPNKAESQLTITSPQPNDFLVFDDISNKFKNTNINLSGGTANQILVKQSQSDFDYRWEDMIINLPEETYTKLLDQASDTVLYLGEAIPNSLPSQSVWRIKKILFDNVGNVEEVRYSGSGLFNQIWNNRTSLVYV